MKRRLIGLSSQVGLRFCKLVRDIGNILKKEYSKREKYETIKFVRISWLKGQYKIFQHLRQSYLK